MNSFKRPSSNVRRHRGSEYPRQALNPATSHVIIADNEDYTPRFIGIEEDLATQKFRHFGKPSTYGDRKTDAVLAVGGQD